MIRYMICLWVLGSMSFVQAQQPTSIYSLTAEDFSDLMPLKEKLKDVKVIALGESTHGLGEFFSLKSRLVKFLHQEMGFEVLAIESGMGDVNWSWWNRNEMTAKELRNNSVFGNFHCEEINPLFEYLKEEATKEIPLEFTGYDCQASSNYFTNEIKQILNHYDTSLGNYWIEGLRAYYQLIPNLQNPKVLKEALYDYNSAMDSIMAYLEKSEHVVRSDFELSPEKWALMMRTIRNFREQANINWFPFNWIDGPALRDSLMAENFFWLMENYFPNKKIIVWAHNGHVEKDKTVTGNVKWMGHFLKERYGNDYYSLGLFVYEGTHYIHWNGETAGFKNDGDNQIEKAFKPRNGLASFTDFRSLRIHKSGVMRPMQGLEPESGGQVRFIPAQRFDGIIVVGEGGIPTY